MARLGCHEPHGNVTLGPAGVAACSAWPAALRADTCWFRHWLRIGQPVGDDRAVNPGESPDAQAVIDRYADRWWPMLTGQTSVVASPGGAWLMLALAASAEPDQTAEALGIESARARELATSMLQDPPRALRTATAIWVGPDQRTPALEQWQAGLPASVGTGPLPTAAEADAWASDVTDGMIPQFPVSITPMTAFVLAGALAANVRWHRPYSTTSAADWGTEGPWAGRVESVLVGEDLSAVRTDDGLFAVHEARAEGLRVICVAATGEKTTAQQTTAQQTATQRGTSVSIAASPLTMVIAADVLRTHLAGMNEDLWSLPLGSHGCWQVSEEPIEEASSARVLHTSVRLPAWEADARWDLLTDPALGFQDAAQRVAGLLAHPGPAQAAQRARARFDRLGFTAATITAVAIMRSAPPGQRESTAGVRRSVRADFAQPFAAFALIDEPDSSWHEVMAFAIWVGEPTEAADSTPPNR